jgi:hypothetical protein
MEVTYFNSTPRTDESIKEYIDIFLANGWLLIETGPGLFDLRNTRYTLGWPEDKGKAVKPKGFKRNKILEI